MLKPLENLAKTKSLDEKVKELEAFCKKIAGKKLVITYENLCYNFDKSFIEKCKENKILVLDGKGGYSFNVQT